MKKLLKVSVAFVMTLALVLTSIVCVAQAEKRDDYCPTILIPGVFQSDVRIYDDNGNPLLNSEGEEYEGPFFLDPSGDIVKLALKKALLPLLKTLITQNDDDNRCKKAVAEVLCEVFEHNASDSNGDTVYNVEAVHYTTSLEKCSEYDRNHILKTIPINEYVDIAGADNVYFLSYNSLGNNLDIAAELYNLILQVREETGSDKVNIVPISMGGSIANTLLEVYNKDGYDVNSMLNRIIYIIPALDGSALIGDLFAKGFIDDDEAIYDYMFPLLVDDPSSVGYIVNLAIRLLPKQVVNDLLDYVVDELVEGFLQNSTAIWGLVPYDEYEIAADKYLSDSEDAEIRRQTDIFHTAQGNRYQNLLNAVADGVKVFDICDYNYSLYPIVDSWDEVNGDGILQLDSTSMGATSCGVDVQLPAGYVTDPAESNCIDPEHHNHIDQYNLVDASTGLFPESTWYFYGQNHESTGSNDVIMKLTVQLLVDSDFNSVHDRADEFPQFNTTRDSKWIRRDIERIKGMDLSTVSDEDKAELNAAILQVETVLEKTVVDTKEYSEACDRFYAIYNKIMDSFATDESREAARKEKISGYINDGLEFILATLCKVVNNTVGYQGYSDAI